MFGKFFKRFQPLKNLFSKIGNGEVVENLFSEKMIHDLLESHNFLKFGEKRYEKKLCQKLNLLIKLFFCVSNFFHVK